MRRPGGRAGRRAVASEKKDAFSLPDAETELEDEDEGYVTNYRVYTVSFEKVDG